METQQSLAPFENKLNYGPNYYVARDQSPGIVENYGLNDKVINVDCLLTINDFDYSF